MLTEYKLKKNVLYIYSSNRYSYYIPLDSIESIHWADTRYTGDKTEEDTFCVYINMKSGDQHDFHLPISIISKFVDDVLYKKRTHHIKPKSKT